ncbi:hypothetical protein UCRPC4_g00143 [Phaeomoniella chlamydospora]|uniref:Nitrogen permease regulator 3 n=1 Tax=Phaeomoniella chlamydospora TaxID=158046 RepID=A0A0G2F4C4_PHACM|nr:hypothetical protein UCRPC4_g00143 [Phaeomoniella chlamydospora]
MIAAGISDALREDGTWQKKKHKHKKKQDALEAEQSEGPTNDDPITTDGASIDPVEPPVAQEELPEKAANMRMFNIVFVLNPPILEYSLRVKEMYDNITKKFAKALKWEQAKSGYVWKEAKLILKLKDKARENRIPMTSLYKEILEQSSLARAIASIYVSISASKIAGPLMLTQDTQPTLQIPPVTSISVLPALTDPPCLPGLWLTTANSINDEHVSSSAQAHSSTSLYLAKHFALLLLDNESTIVKDIMASAGPLAPELVRYIRASHPTKSFAKVSVRASISLNDIRLLADHLVYWRRARAITPLHQRDTYIVSPNADMRRLPAACKAYEVTFPALPSLPNMLAALSGPPRPYGTLIPSKDHKEAYFQILAWLLRGGWVTQLRTFAWIRVDKDVKLAVDRTMKEERKRERSEDQKNGSNELAELQHYFPIFAKEMDGSEALEKIPIIHGMKRLKAWEILNRIGVGDPRVSVDDGDTAPEMEETASRPNGTGTVNGRGEMLDNIIYG